MLGRLFRRLFLERLAAAFADGGLRFFGDLVPLAEPRAFAAHCAALRRIDWVVYAKPPFGGPEQVLAYLGRYTHRVAIANSRLVTLNAARAFRLGTASRNRTTSSALSTTGRRPGSRA